MSKKIQVEVHFHVPSDDGVSRDLRRLTRKIAKLGLAEAAVCGIFGGENGYGAEYENDVFEMHWDRQHPSCDCGASKPKHKDECDTVTKRRAWLDERNAVGMVRAYPDPAPEEIAAAEASGDAFAMFDLSMKSRWMSNTPTTYQEQSEWMKANPFPSCSCGEESAWRARNPGIEPNDDDDGFFDGPHPGVDFTHARSCDWSIVYRPHFLHKASGSTVEWYKYIGRDIKLDLKADWAAIMRDCMASLKQAPR